MRSVYLGLILSGLAGPVLADKAVFAGGCFWCVEKDFESVEGVSEVISGFTGGTVPNPTYKQVVSKKTGHIEAVVIEYDPAVVEYRELVKLFLRSIDATDSGGQFCDRGHSYTTAIFAADEVEAKVAEEEIALAEKELGQTIATPVFGQGPFYPAEEYHQDYYKKQEIVLTRFGPKSKAEAYKRYRKACGRDARVKELWGDAAPFAN